MKRRGILALVLSAAVILSGLSVCFVALGDDITWEFDRDNGTLFIYGTSAMDDFEDEFSSPWSGHINTVKRVVIGEGVKSIGAYAFSGMTNLESVSIPDSVTSLNAYCLSSCPALRKLSLGSNIIAIADESFAYNGIQKKADFVVNTDAGSYPLYFAIKNNISFNVQSVPCGLYTVYIKSAGSNGYFPYTPKCDGTFRFYSIGNYDTIGYLFDSSFNRIAYNDDASSSDTNFCVTARLRKGETYYLSAELFSTGLRGSFDMIIQATAFTVEGNVLAMADRTGAPSDVTIDDALMDGSSINSSFVLDVSGGSVTKTFTYGLQSQTITFTPDSDCIVVFMACDVNNDRYVNAKDFAAMRKTNSKYFPLYQDLINYSY